MVQVRPTGKTEKMLLVRTNVADADECCMFGKPEGRYTESVYIFERLYLSVPLKRFRIVEEGVRMGL